MPLFGLFSPDAPGAATILTIDLGTLAPLLWAGIDGALAVLVVQARPRRTTPRPAVAASRPAEGRRAA